MMSERDYDVGRLDARITALDERMTRTDANDFAWKERFEAWKERNEENQNRILTMLAEISGARKTHLSIAQWFVGALAAAAATTSAWIAFAAHTFTGGTH